MRFDWLRSSALLLVPALVLTAPADSWARKKKDTGGISVSEVFRTEAGRARAAIDAGDMGSAQSSIAALLPSNPAENYIAASLRMEYAGRRNDPQAMRKALTDILESGAVPAAEIPYLRYLAGYYSFYLGEYEDARAQINYARQLGLNSVDSTMVLAETAVRQKKVAEANGLVDQALQQMRASGKPISASFYDRAVSLAYQTGNWQDVARYYQEKLRSYPSVGNWRDALTNYQAVPGMDSSVKLDLMRLQAATGALASERDYEAYAQAAADAGYDAEAKAIIDSGISNGKLTAGNGTTTALLKKSAPKAVKTTAGLSGRVAKAAKAASGSESASLGDDYFAMAQYPQAAAQYRQAISKGGVNADRVNLRLGIALARSGDLAGGKAALSQVSGNWSNIARFWDIWVDQRSMSAAANIPAASPAS